MHSLFYILAFRCLFIMSLLFSSVCGAFFILYSSFSLFVYSVFVIFFGLLVHSLLYILDFSFLCVIFFGLLVHSLFYIPDFRLFVLFLLFSSVCWCILCSKF